MSFRVEKKKRPLSLEHMADLLAWHYLDNAKWPSAADTVYLAKICKYKGDMNAAIDRALDNVQSEMRTWEEYHDPEKRRWWVNLVGERQVAKDEARRDRFIETMCREPKYPADGDAFGWLMAQMLKWGHDEQ